MNKAQTIGPTKTRHVLKKSQPHMICPITDHIFRGPGTMSTICKHYNFVYYIIQNIQSRCIIMIREHSSPCHRY